MYENTTLDGRILFENPNCYTLARSASSHSTDEVDDLHRLTLSFVFKKFNYLTLMCIVLYNKRDLLLNYASQYFKVFNKSNKTTLAKP